MTGSTVKRSAFATFMNVGTILVPDYVIIGDGITAASIEYNPQTLEETYINQDSGSTEIESYRPTLPIEATAKSGDEVFDFVDALRQARAVLDAAKTDIVNVWLYEAEITGTWPAEKQECSIQIDSFGGDGGGSAKINYTINFIGDPIPGTFNPTTFAFVATP